MVVSGTTTGALGGFNTVTGTSLTVTANGSVSVPYTHVLRVQPPFC